MTTKSALKGTPKAASAISPAATWRRDLLTSLALAAGVFLGTCAFATVWAATHPLALSA